MVDLFDPCALCAARILPPDNVSIQGGRSLRMAIALWLEANTLRTEQVIASVLAPEAEN